MDRDLDAFLAEHLAIALAGPAPLPILPRPEDLVWRPSGRRGRPTCSVRWVRPDLADMFPGVRVRSAGRLPGSSPGGWANGVSSRKVGRIVDAHSKLERRHILDVEFDREALTMCEQPLSLRLAGGPTVRPDAFVWMRSGLHEIREVKPRAKVAQFANRWEEVGAAVASLGFVYRVVTETRMRHPPREANVGLFMSRRHAEPPSETILEELWKDLAEKDRSAGEILARFPSISRKQLMGLVRLQFLAVLDLDRPFDDASVLERQTRRIRRVAEDYRSDCLPGRFGGGSDTELQ